MRSRIGWIFVLAFLAIASTWVVWSNRNTAKVGKLPPNRTTGIVEAAFVPEQHCVDCHSEQADEHSTSGHSDTFHSTIEFDAISWLDGQIFEDPERPYSYHFHYDNTQGLGISIPKQFGDRRFPLTYALGSGHNALTFLSLIPDRFGDTIGIEHRISLFAEGSGWAMDITPGQRATQPLQDIEHFGRVLRGDTLESCIDCHTVSSQIAGEAIENLIPHVGCQGCHGAGSNHVAAMNRDDGAKGSPYTPKTARDELEMCGKCHRVAHTESDVDVSPDDVRIVRFQSVGLPQSRCFKESDGELKCTTCHSPHSGVSRDSSHYVNRCLSCHSDAKHTKCPVSPTSNCIQCHMPAIDVHRGIEFHDHWIRVRSVGLSGNEPVNE